MNWSTRYRLLTKPSKLTRNGASLEAPFFFTGNTHQYPRTIDPMNNKLIPLLAILTLLLTPWQAIADNGGKPNEQAQKNASDNAAFNRDNKDQDKDHKKDKEHKKDKDKEKDKDNKDKKKKNKDKKDD